MAAAGASDPASQPPALLGNQSWKTRRPLLFIRNCCRRSVFESSSRGSGRPCAARADRRKRIRPRPAGRPVCDCVSNGIITATAAAATWPRLVNLANSCCSVVWPLIRAAAWPPPTAPPGLGHCPTARPRPSRVVSSGEEGAGYFMRLPATQRAALPRRGRLKPASRAAVVAAIVQGGARRGTVRGTALLSRQVLLKGEGRHQGAPSGPSPAVVRLPRIPPAAVGPEPQRGTATHRRKDRAKSRIPSIRVDKTLS